MIVRHGIRIDMDALAALCERYHVRELSLFGSAVRDALRDDSDLDILVEFQPDAPIGLFEYVALRGELEDLFGRTVDLVEKPGLKPLIRDSVTRLSEILYAA